MYKYLVLLSSLVLCVRSDVVCTRHETLVTCTPESADYSVTLQRGSVSDDEDIEEIYASKCKLSMIESDAFENIPNLKRLDLSVNSIVSIDELFNAMHNLRYLNLSRNLITDISSDVFKSMTSLQTLDLCNNRIKDIQNNAFEQTTKLTSLHLSFNLLINIEQELIAPLTELRVLDLSRNTMSNLAIEVFDPVTKLNTLDLCSSKFSPIPDGIFDRLTELTSLSLSMNNITEFNDNHIQYNIQLRSLDLSYNSIEKLDVEVFEKLSKLKVLNVSKNLLTDTGFVTPLTQLTTLDLSKNQFDSLPAINSSTLRIIDISGNRFTNLGMNVGNLLPKRMTKMMIHNNPWQCSCLVLITAVLQKREIAYQDRIYFNGKRPVCVVPDKPGRCTKETIRHNQLIADYTKGTSKYIIN